MCAWQRSDNASHTTLKFSHILRVRDILQSCSSQSFLSHFTRGCRIMYFPSFENNMCVCHNPQPIVFILKEIKRNEIWNKTLVHLKSLFINPKSSCLKGLFFQLLLLSIMAARTPTVSLLSKSDLSIEHGFTSCFPVMWIPCKYSDATPPQNKPMALTLHYFKAVTF